MPKRTEIAKRPLQESEEDIELILETYGQCLDRTKTSELTHFTEWTVRKVLAQMPPGFELSLLRGNLIDTVHLALAKLRAAPIPWVPKDVGVLLEALNNLDGGGRAGVKTAVQNIINISSDEATRLRETIDSVEGQIVDDTDG
jgi:hypothetical protein